MLSKNTIKLINSLTYKKYRDKENLFIIEGDKNIEELLKNKNISIMELYANSTFLNRLKNTIKDNVKVVEISHAEMKKISRLKTPQNCLAVCHKPQNNIMPQELNNISIYLDDLQDPGNLGTILRICDWFAVEYLFCSNDTVDIYNPKVIQASMGSFARVNTVYIDFTEILPVAEQSGTAILSTEMNGNSIYSYKMPQNCLLIMGNEGNGVKEEIICSSKDVLSIPNFGNAESLNVGVATAIFCSEYCRRNV